MSRLTWVIAIVFFIHGIGHIMCMMPALGLNASPTWNSESWLLTGLIGQRATNVVAVIIWLAAAGCCFGRCFPDRRCPLLERLCHLV